MDHAICILCTVLTLNAILQPVVVTGKGVLHLDIDIAVLHLFYISYRNIQFLGEIHTHPHPTHGCPWNDILLKLSISLHTLREYCTVDGSRNDLRGHSSGSCP